MDEMDPRREQECGVVELYRNSEIDAQLDLSAKDPISMCRYLSVALECMKQKKDMILAIVITAGEERECTLGHEGKGVCLDGKHMNSCIENRNSERSNDYLERDLVSKGSIYLASSINRYRFIMCDSNPNVIWISKRDVRDPVSQRIIRDIYYYGVFFKDLREAIYPVLERKRGCSRAIARIQDIVDLGLLEEEVSHQEESPDSVVDSTSSSVFLVNCFSSPGALIRLRAMYLGTEHDFAANSVFNEYVQLNSIFLEEQPRNIETIRKIVEKEKQVFNMCLLVMFILTCISFSISASQKLISPPIILVHSFLFFITLFMFYLNMII